MRAASDPIWRRTGSSCQSYGTGSAGDRWRLSTVWYQQPKVKMGWQRLERSHLFKKQKQNPQRTNKTKNKTALSRIWRHNREVHHPHPLTLPWKLTVHLHTTGTKAPQLLHRARQRQVTCLWGSRTHRPFTSACHQVSRLLSAFEQGVIFGQAEAAQIKASWHYHLLTTRKPLPLQHRPQHMVRSKGTEQLVPSAIPGMQGSFQKGIWHLSPICSCQHR